MFWAHDIVGIRFLYANYLKRTGYDVTAAGTRISHHVVVAIASHWHNKAQRVEKSCNTRADLFKWTFLWVGEYLVTENFREGLFSRNLAVSRKQNPRSLCR